MFYSQIQKLCAENGTTVTTVTHKLGFSNGARTGWKEGRSPSSDVVLKFAEYFGVTTDYLLGRSEEPNPASAIPTQLNVQAIKDSALLIGKGETAPYDALSPENKAIIDTIIESLLKQQN